MLDKTDKEFITSAVETAVGQLMSAVNVGFEDTNGKLDKVENRLDKVENRLDKVENRLGGVEDGLHEVKSELSDVKRRLIDLETDTPSETQCRKNEKRISKLESAVFP